MHLLVGLGNPGSKYKRNRHNVGHLTVDMIAKKYNFTKKNKNKFGDVFEGQLLNEKIFALKPKDFINLSGVSIKKFLDFYKINIKNLLVIHDDIDLPIGKIKIKIGGGNAGHNGLKNIDAVIGKNYKRIRIGIDRPKNNKSVDKFVLENFEKKEEKEIKFSINSIISFLQYLISSDANNISILMNKLSEK